MKSLRQEVIEQIVSQYGAEPEHLWLKFPEYVVFRHKDNKKWFAIFMNISEAKLGLEAQDEVDIMVVKCNPILVSILKNEKGFLPAYHMNKNNWITVLLDGSCPLDKIYDVIEESYRATEKKLGFKDRGEGEGV